MKPIDLNELLSKRDLIIASSPEFSTIVTSAIENEAIRELGRIVLETSNQECTVFSCS